MYTASDFPASAALYAEAQKYLPGGNTRTTVFQHPFPLYAARGEGCHVWDVDGVRRIDCINNYTAMIHGHAKPEITQAVTRQLALGTCFGMPTPSEIDLARELSRRVASVERVRFMNSGTEAVMMAIKAARAYTGRPKIAKVEGAYHGSYDPAEVSLDSQPAQWGEDLPRSVPYAAGTPGGVLDDVIVIPFNDPPTAQRLIARHGKDLAAILIDPLPNRAGLVGASEEFLATLRQAADAAGALLIFDEVISFRLAHGGAQSLFGTTPDLTTFGKVIGGGFPVGAVGGRREVMAVFDPTGGKPALPHGGTFSANPVTMTAGLAALQALDAPAFAHLDRIGQAVRDGANEALKRHGLPGRAVGMGSLLRIHFTGQAPRDYRSIYPDAQASARLKTFVDALLTHGVLAAGYGLMALSTPMGEREVTQIVDAIDRALTDTRRAG